MSWSSLLMIAATVLALIIVAFTALVLFLHEYAFRPKQALRPKANPLLFDRPAVATTRSRQQAGAPKTKMHAHV